MTALVLSANEQQASLRANLPKSGKNRKTIKHVLMTPYKTDWPVLDRDIEVTISTKLHQHLQQFALPHEKAGLKRKNLENNEIKERKNILRAQVVFGVNSVTKALEKDLLQLVLTCKSADPPILTKHLLSLSESRKCVAICLDGLNKMLTDVLKMGSVAVGFYKFINSGTELQDFKELIDYVNNVAPKPWLEEEKIQKLERDAIETRQDKSEIQKGKIFTNEKLRETDEALKKTQNNNCSSADYSRFYVFKKDLPKDDSFIPLNVDSPETTNKLSVLKSDSKKRKQFDMEDTTEYVKINVQKMKPNENKKKKKKLKRKANVN